MALGSSRGLHRQLSRWARHPSAGRMSYSWALGSVRVAIAVIRSYLGMRKPRSQHHLAVASFQRLRERNVRHAFLNTTTDNVSAQAAYYRMGFRTVDRQVDFEAIIE